MSTQIRSTIKALDSTKEGARMRFIDKCKELAEAAEAAGLDGAERLREMADRQRRTRENGLVIIGRDPVILTDAQGRQVAPGWHSDF
jgi:hypothetical protein